jgi:hypothetical protein
MAGQIYCDDLSLQRQPGDDWIPGALRRAQAVNQKEGAAAAGTDIVHDVARAWTRMRAGSFKWR